MKIAFYTLLQNRHDAKNIELLIASLRTFGGKFRNAPIWIFHLENIEINIFKYENVTLIPLEMEAQFHRIWFSAKVFTAAQAEILANRQKVDSLIWFGSSGFIVNPPEQFDLGTDFDAAFRPVHHKNVGQLISEKMDDFWQEIYDFVELVDPNLFVKTFVERDKIRPYFNSHLFSVNPRKQILQKWKDSFVNFHKSEIPNKSAFADQLHQIFIHQALLSVLLVKHLNWKRIKILSADYSYPLHLHRQVPKIKQPKTLNELVCPVYEGIFMFPETLNGLKVEEPLAEWLKEKMK